MSNILLEALRKLNEQWSSQDEYEADLRKQRFEKQYKKRLQELTNLGNLILTEFKSEGIQSFKCEPDEDDDFSGLDYLHLTCNKKNNWKTLYKKVVDFIEKNSKFGVDSWSTYLDHDDKGQYMHLALFA